MNKFIVSLKCIVVLVVLVMAHPAGAQTPSADLDKLVASEIEALNIAGASVMVVDHGKVILQKGYGFADLSFRVPTTPDTRYFLVGPGGMILSACILQLIEQGKLGLDDLASTYLPDYPWDGRPVKIRHLLNSTSGVMDYHYLGDPLEGTYRTPKASDEVIGLFAGRGYTSSAPGIKWDWSISNFALLVEILEKVTNSTYKDYLQQHVIAPLSLKETTYLEERQLIPRFARGYGKQNGELIPTYQSLMTYDPSLRISISAGDLFKIWDGIRSGKLISQQSYAMVTAPEGAGIKISDADPTLQFGYILRIRKVAGTTVMGLHGALPGYSSHCYYYPEKDLTVVVLANTSNQYANEIGNAIGLHMLGQPVPAVKPDSRFILADKQTSPEEARLYSGTYQLMMAPDNLRHDSYALYTRTVRIFPVHGRLQIQELGDSPDELFRQEDGSFATFSSPAERIKFEVVNEKELRFTTSLNGKVLSIAKRIGDASINTFHGAYRSLPGKLPGKWMMLKVYESGKDESAKHNPKKNRWFRFNKDGTFVSDGDPFGKNNGKWRFDPLHGVLYIDSATEDDDSEWNVTLYEDKMEWTGIGHPRKENTRLIFQYVQDK